MRYLFLIVSAVVLLLAGRHSDRYPGFEAHYAEPDMLRPYPVNAQYMERRSIDITSCLYRDRNQLRQMLECAALPAQFDPNRQSLQLILDGQDIAVDQLGVVRIAGKSRKLSDLQRSEYRMFMFAHLPVNDPRSLLPESQE
jgi:hypothetical protein